MLLQVKVENDFRITIPETLRTLLHVGDELLITSDAAGRIIIIPKERALEILQRTAGMWADRTDIPGDGVEYVNQLRQGRRLRELGLVAHGD